MTSTNETTAIVPDRSAGRKPRTVQPHIPVDDVAALAARQQAAADREATALRLLAENLTDVPCGTGRRALGVHTLLAVEETLSRTLGPCGKREYQRAVDHYLKARHGHEGGAA